MSLFEILRMFSELYAKNHIGDLSLNIVGKDLSGDRSITSSFNFHETKDLETTRIRKGFVTRVLSLGQEDTLEKDTAIHSNTLAWKIPWTEETGRLQFIGLQRVRHDWMTSLSLFLFFRLNISTHILHITVDSWVPCDPSWIPKKKFNHNFRVHTNLWAEPKDNLITRHDIQLTAMFLFLFPLAVKNL